MGIRQMKTVEVHREDVALAASAYKKVSIPSQNMPSGLIKGFTLILRSAAVTDYASAASDYQKVLRTITYGSAFPKHKVMNAQVGLEWDRHYSWMMRKAMPRTSPTADGFMCSYYLPFAWEGLDRFLSYRPKDTGLMNVNNKALPTVDLQLGPYTDLDSSATACTVTVILLAHYEPVLRPGVFNSDNPALSGDQPVKVLSIDSQEKADLATVCSHSFLTGEGRETLAVLFRELDTSDVEKTDIFTSGVATPSKCVFRRGNSDEYNSDVKINDLDIIAEKLAGVAHTAGYHAWFATQAGKLSAAVSLRQSQTFKAFFDNLATTASRKLNFLQVCTLDLPDEIKAIHAAQLKA